MPINLGRTGIDLPPHPFQLRQGATLGFKEEVRMGFQHPNPWLRPFIPLWSTKTTIRSFLMRYLTPQA